jgi:regulator of replication initiation timing
MTKDDEIQRFKKRVRELERENDELKQENKALRKRIDFARGALAEKLIAKLTDG